ncbi:MAG: hypothetical protein PVJ01_01510 [Pseudomonadota bacterium]|jgi:hypothetical protein
MKALRKGTLLRNMVVVAGCLALILGLGVLGCTKKEAPKPTLVFADPGWTAGRCTPG